MSAGNRENIGYPGYLQFEGWDKVANRVEYAIARLEHLDAEERRMQEKDWRPDMASVLNKWRALPPREQGNVYFDMQIIHYEDARLEDMLCSEDPAELQEQNREILTQWLDLPRPAQAKVLSDLANDVMTPGDRGATVISVWADRVRRFRGEKH